MFLIRYLSDSYGTFGVLSSEHLDFLLHTLEHSYLNKDLPLYRPKIPTGKYLCKRGMHQLEGMASPFETFEITGVPGHTNLLFHVGNVQNDSSGCILLGKEIASSLVLCQSKQGFREFMKYLEGMNEFALRILQV